MGFISFSLSYYKTELAVLEGSPVDEQTICQARRLLKMLDDLVDEGYTELYCALEKELSGVSRLRAYLKNNNSEPFPVLRKTFSPTDISYDEKPCELTAAISELAEDARESAEACDDAFIKKLVGFCDRIGYEQDTAYVFLLRDALVPYVYYLNKNRKHIYPWLLGRRALAKLTGNNNADDEFRASVFEASESGDRFEFEQFCDSVLPAMRSTLKRYPEAERSLRALLDGIGEKRVVVVESGCAGTFPLLLMSLDRRVDLRMYTTYPYLTAVYGDKIFTPEYEEIRLFETLYSQDLYFRFSHLRDGRFFVEKCASAQVKRNALAEIKTVLSLSKRQ